VRIGEYPVRPTINDGSMLDFTRFQVLTFDCYGTLINWEAGIFSALKPILAAHGKPIADDALLEIYGELEAQAEQGEFRPYQEVLQSVVRGFGDRLGFSPTKTEQQSLPGSVPNWRPFPDTVAALRKLQARYRLAVISNIDDNLFAASARRLEIAFDQVITAQQARCYKPGLAIFKMALARIGVAPEHALHVGQSVYHDVVPARSLGMATVWVNRLSPRPNAGAVKLATGTPDLTVSDLQSLANLAVPASSQAN
jgi:2-haloacid dehalogenase